LRQETSSWRKFGLSVLLHIKASVLVGQQVAQQSMHLTPGILRQSQAVSYALESVS
jgi:hypothetical protein